MFAVAVGAGEERILSIEGDGADTAFDDIGVDLGAAIVEEATEPSPARERVADRFGELALLADQRKLPAQSQLERFDDRSASLLTCGTPLFGRAAPDLALNPVEFGDAGERLRCDRRGSGLRQFVEAATHMVSAVLRPRP